MKGKIDTTYAVKRDGGFAEASSFLGDSAPNSLGGLTGVASLGDASTQVPNLRAPEMFSALWAARKYESLQIETDIMVTGTVGQFSRFWGPWSVDEQLIEAWRNFYSPYGHRIKLLSLAPVSVLKFDRGTIADQRFAALEKIARNLDGVSGFDANQVLERIKIVEFLQAIERAGITLGQVAESVPSGKSIGTWTCPCCATRVALRLGESGYAVTESRGATLDKNCLGILTVRSQVSDEMSLAKLIRGTGIELNFFASVCLLDIVESASSTLMVRDYSNPRGNIAEAISRYGSRLCLTTRFYLVGPDGDSDLTFDQLYVLTKEQPSRFVHIMDNHPVVSEGGCLIVNCT